MISRASLTLALLALIGCDAGKAFNSTTWKRDGGKAYDSIRPLMINDFRRQYPKGSDRSQVVAALGPSEANFPDICGERRDVDDCSFHFVGSRGVDPIVLVVGFQNNKTVAYWEREL